MNIKAYYILAGRGDAHLLSVLLQCFFVRGPYQAADGIPPWSSVPVRPLIPLPGQNVFMRQPDMRRCGGHSM